MQKTQIRSLGQEDAWEKEMATHSSILAWKIPWTKESGGLQSMGSQESDRTECLNNKNNNNVQRQRNPKMRSNSIHLFNECHPLCMNHWTEATMNMARWSLPL